MFTLEDEDVDLAADLAYIRENGSRFLPQDVARHGHTDPDADAASHPYDYLILR